MRPGRSGREKPGRQAAPPSGRQGHRVALIPGRARRGETLYRSATRRVNSRRGTLGIGDDPQISTFELYQNYPNPFNPATMIRFSLAHRVKVKLEIFNLLGQRVKTLVDAALAPGQHRLIWDGRNDAGLRVSSGVYFYRLKAGDYVKSRKMVLIR